MKNIHINNSYNIWNIPAMRYAIKEKCLSKFNATSPENMLNRSFRSMYIEWWLHNIGYYVTLPFCSIDSIKKINLKCKDVDLEEWTYEKKS